MALHPDFPRSPYVVLPPDLRWFPAAEELRSTAYKKLLPPLVAKIRDAVKAWRGTNYAGASATSRALLANEQDQSAVKSVMPDSMAGIADVLPLLDIGEAIVLGDSILLPSRIKLDMPKARPLSLTKNFWKEWGEKSSTNTAIKTAVESLRMQSKG